MAKKQKSISRVLVAAALLLIASLHTVVLAGDRHQVLSDSVSIFAASGGKPQLDSLIATNRYECYKLEREKLEFFFDSGDSSSLMVAEETAGALGRVFSDNYFGREAAKYKKWRQAQMGVRKKLKQEFAILPAKLGSLPPDSVLALLKELSRKFLNVGDSAAAAKVLQVSGAMISISADTATVLVMLQKSKEICRRAGDLDGQARSYTQLGNVYQHIGIFAKAGDYFDSARVIKERIGDRKGEADCLNNIAAVYFSLDDLDQAYRFSGEALKIRRTTLDTAQICQSLFNMISSFAEHRPLSEVDDWLNEARLLVISQDDFLLTARLSECEGIVAEQRSQPGDALNYYQGALSAIETRNQSRFQISLLLRIGSLQSSMGDYSQALKSYMTANTIAEETHNLAALSNITHNLGTVYQRLGDNDQAVRYYQRSLDIKRQLRLPQEMIETLNNLADVYLKANDQKTAEEYLAQSLQTAQLYDNRGAFAETAITMARLKLRQGAYAGAVALLDSAIAIYGAANNTQKEFDALLQKVETLRSDKELPESKATLDITAASLAKLPSFDNLRRYEQETALYWDDVGNKDSAYLYLSKTVARLESARQHIPDERLRSSNLQETRFVYEKLADILAGKCGSGKNAGVDSLLSIFEQAKSRSLLDMLNSAKLNIRSHAPADYVAEEQKALVMIENIEQGLGGVDNPKARQFLLDQLAQANMNLNEARLKISLADPAASQIFYPDHRRLADAMISVKGTKAAILDYFLMSDKSFLIVISAGGRELYQLPARNEITKQVAAYSEVIQRSVKEEGLIDSLNSLAGTISKVLLGDFLPQLRKYSQLYICPDGVLHMFPFEALKTDGKYLVEDHEISLVPSLYLIDAASASLRRDKPSILIVADPVIGPDLQALPYSGKEADWIAEIFPESDRMVLKGASASRSALFSLDAGKYRYLHFATHSTINYDDPLRSRIWLSRDSSDNTSGYLTLDDILTMNLNAEVVVLSACESGGGQFALGDGIDGFARGFMYAGCRNVMVSFWQVEDFTTASFMKTFYRNIGQGLATALRTAKLEMINSPRLKYRLPYYWAPFELIRGAQN